MRFLALSISAHRYTDAGMQTGMWLGEYTHFYDSLSEAGHAVDLASVEGGTVPIDPVSLQPPVIQLGGTNKRYADPGFMAQLDNTPAIEAVDLGDYAGIYLTGGHSALFDFSRPEVKRAVAHFAESGGIVSAVCHGPSGLLDVELSSGKTLLADKRVTGDSWAEEKLARRADTVPFSLEDRLKKEAAAYHTARVPMTKHVVVDGQLVTGQNPMSATGIGEAVLAQL